MAQIVNTFGGGMDKDTNPNSYKSTTYFHAENLRLIVDNTLSSATLTSVKKHKKIFSWARDFSLVGFTSTSTYLIFFFKEGRDGGKIIFLEKEELKTETTIDLDTKGESIVKAFNFGERVEVIARQETKDILKIYWADGVNPIRFCNLLEEGIENNPIEAFEIVQDVEFGEIKIEDTIAGGLKSGTYQYAYCHYNLNGAESAYSPPTAFYPLSNSFIESSRTSTFKGSPSGETTSKGLRVILAPDERFNRVRIVRLYRVSQEISPEITIVYEGPRIKAFNDTGFSLLGTLILEELTEAPNFFKAKTLQDKNNFLFAGNLEDIPIDEEWLDTWDSRTYRYKRASVSTLRLNPIDLEDIATSEPSIGSPEYDTYTTSPKNIIDSEPSLQDYKYQKSSVVLGGAGENIKYSFIGGSYSIIGTEALRANNEDKLYLEDFSKIGYQSDEIYRMAIIFWDKKGRSTFPKWIEDIRFPDLTDSGGAIGTVDNRKIRIKGIKFEINTKDVPSEFTHFSIVRARRTPSDRTVLDSGYISHLTHNNDEGFFATVPTRNLRLTGDFAYLNKLVEYICPDALVNKSSLGQTDRIDIYNGTGVKLTKKRNTTDQKNYNIGVTKCWPSAINSNKVTRKEVEATKIPISKDMLSKKTIEGMTFNLRNSVSSTEPEPSAGYGVGYGARGTCDVFYIEEELKNSDLDVLSSTTTTAPYCLRRRFTTPYGGTTLQSLSQTNYLLCPSEDGVTMFPCTGETQEVNIYGGDTYISVAEVQRILMNEQSIRDNASLVKAAYANVVLAVVESTINYNYIQNPTWTSLDDGSVVASNVSIYKGQNLYHNLWETAGVQVTDIDGDIDYIQTYDLYTYNPVYSPINNTKVFFSKPLDLTFYTEFKHRVTNSDKKFDGELSDSWVKFRVNNVFDVSSAHGEITRLIEFNDRLVCVQAKGVGVLPVEDREVIQSQNTASLVVGAGGVMGRIDYLTTNSGTSFPGSVYASTAGIYYIDSDLNKICRVTDKEEFISDTKGMFSYLKSLNTLGNPTTVYNPIFKEVMFHIGTDRLFYTEYMQNFSTFYVDGVLPIYLHSLEYEGKDYYVSSDGVYTEGNSHLTPKLEIISNPSNTKVCRFDSIALSSYSEVSTGLPLQDLQCSTQEGQETMLLDKSTFRERMRVFRCNALRDASKSRLISHYLKHKYVFQATDLKVYDIATTFTPLNI